MSCCSFQASIPYERLARRCQHPLHEPKYGVTLSLPCFACALAVYPDGKVCISISCEQLENDNENSLCCFVHTVYPDGKVCISILHNPGDDPMGYESAAERWSPVHTVSDSSEQMHMLYNVCGMSSWATSLQQSAGPLCTR